MRKLIISLCFKIINSLVDNHIVEPDEEVEKLVDDLVIGVLCQCPQGSLCEFFTIDEDGDELCLYGKI